jgi:glycosyltransferase involved in cell wall biosynthesis
LSAPVPIPVLFLAMEFAPVNTTGNYRSLKFVKYLRTFGIEPVVITFKEEEAASFFNAKIDKGLLNDIPSGTAIYRVHCGDGKKYYKNRFRRFTTIFFSIKDNFAVRWKKYLFKELGSIIERHNPRAIFTSLPPFSSGMLSVEISRIYNIPLITDMRDAWAMWGYAPFATRVHFGLTIAEEAKIFKHSAAIIGVTPQIIRNFKRSHPQIDASKFHYIPNGFDGEMQTHSSFDFPSNPARIRIGYVGTLYYNAETRESIFKPWWKRKRHRKLQYTAVKEDWLYRSPYFFLKMLASLFLQYPYMKNIVMVDFVGKKPTWLVGMIAEFGLGENVTLHGFVTHQEAKKIQEGFDLILATSEKVIGDEHYCLPSKSFDSIGMNKPVLGFVTEGIQKEFIECSGLGIICDPDNTQQSVDTFMELVKHGKTFSPNREYIASFHRKNLASSLADVFKQVINN